MSKFTLARRFCRATFVGSGLFVAATSLASCAQEQEAAPKQAATRAAMNLVEATSQADSAPQGEQYTAKSATEINAIDEKLKPGDTLILRDGEWKDKGITFRAKGTAEKPITLRAATPGQVIFTGTSKLDINGQHIVVSGLVFKDTAASGDTIALNGKNCRLTQSAIIGGTSKFFVHLRGSNNQVDHCYLAGKTSESPTLQVEAEEKPNNHLLEFNHFGPRAPLGANGGETIRIGYSNQSMNNSRTTVRRNFFDRCDGEIEVISNKSCENIYRANTFFECAGMLTLRHGNRCLVDGNIFIGNEKEGSGGVRIIGEDHVVVNNYVEGAPRGGFWITAGVPNSPLNGYFKAKNALIAFNTIVDSSGPYFDLDSGIGTSKRTEMPENITIADNLLVSTKGKIDFRNRENGVYNWLGNLASVKPKNAPDGAVTVADLKLKRGADGLLRPQNDALIAGAAQGGFAFPKTDIDGQTRPAKTDIGCDQIADTPPIYGKLNATSTGPTWMKRE